MRTVLLVEDEYYVRKSLRETVDWNEIGFQVIGEASNGLEAFSFIEQHHPDVVISDIVMPKMDGIELLRQVREKGWDSRFLMLTCKNEFDYARQALEYGSSNYILKLSMSEATLKQALLKIDKELNQRTTATSMQHSVNYQELYGRIRKSLFDKSMYLSGALSPFILESLGEFSTCQLVIATVIHPNRNAPDHSPFIRTLLDPQGCVHYFTEYGQTTCFFWTRKSPEELTAAILANLPSLSAYRISSLGRLAGDWLSMLQQLDSHWYDEDESDIDHAASSQRNAAASFNLHSMWPLETKFIRALEAKNTTECLSILDAMWKTMAEQRLPSLLVKETAERLNQILSMSADLQGIPPEDWLSADNHHDLKQQLLHRFQIYCERMELQPVFFCGHKEIDKIIAFVLHHYEQEITLKSMARYVSMDENYLSSLFKKKMGEAFVHFLHRVRVEKAIQLLQNKELTVGHIAEAVGFPNDNYFIKIFKRHMQTTPNLYRKSLFHGQQTRNDL